MEIPGRAPSRAPVQHGNQRSPQWGAATDTILQAVTPSGELKLIDLNFNVTLEVWNQTMKHGSKCRHNPSTDTYTNASKCKDRPCVCVWSTVICWQAGTRELSVGEFCVYKFSLFETQSKFIIHPLCGGFVLSLKALTQCKHSVLKGDLFLILGLKQREHRKWTPSWRGKQTDSLSVKLIWFCDVTEYKTSDLRVRRVLGYWPMVTHGECMCGRNVLCFCWEHDWLPRCELLSLFYRWWWEWWLMPHVRWWNSESASLLGSLTTVTPRVLTCKKPHPQLLPLRIRNRTCIDHQRGCVGRDDSINTIVCTHVYAHITPMQLCGVRNRWEPHAEHYKTLRPSDRV